MNWMKNHVGMIRWSSYWKMYSLVLSVDCLKNEIVELDQFGEVNCKPALVRVHGTALSEHDRFYTVQEFAKMIQSGQVSSVDINGKENKFNVS